ncbi:MAG TPA: extracellular solute-binding protein, partial [Candidatus Binatia bacterium]|nr:extracellular solute-binding protein [Candidatus Binatia bacterium]
MRYRTKPIAVLVGLILAISACGAPAQSGGGTTEKLTIAAVQGVEDAGLKALAPMYTEETGIEIEIVESPYADLYTKLVNAFQANDATYDLVMMDDPWMPKFGTGGWLTPLDSTFGFQRDPDIPGIVYDVGTWPPPKGPVPPQ